MNIRKETHKEKVLEFERFIFFSDAIIAIAITLLVFDLKIPDTANGHLSFTDLRNWWPKFSSFLLSFLIIYLFWKNHHKFFSQVKQMDGKLMRYNIRWLLFIIMIPFSTSLISRYFDDVAAMFAYSLNILLVSIFQYKIWNYINSKPELQKETITAVILFENVLYCRVSLVLSFLATGISFYKPPVAFIVLFFRAPIFSLFKLLLKPKFQQLSKTGQI